MWGDGGIEEYSRYHAALKARAVYVYLVSCGPYLKIGIAADVKARIGDLQIGNPYPLTLAWQSRAMRRSRATQIERKAHRVVEQHHWSGEWFDVSLEVALEAISKARLK